MATLVRERATIRLPLDVCRRLLVLDDERDRLARAGFGARAEIQLLPLEAGVTQLLLTASGPGEHVAAKATAKRLVRHLAARIRKGSLN